MRPPRGLGATLLTAALAAGAGGCFEFGKELERQAKAFQQGNPDGLRSIQAQGHALRYAAAGPLHAPAVLFIHGSPGGWDAWAAYLRDPDLTSTCRVMAVDRPGYGGSEPGVAVPSLAEQARRIAAVLDAEGGPAVVVGHSLGGPVACQLALDFPDKVRGLLLLAPSIDPAQEKTKWFQVPAAWPWVRPLLPRALDVCNQEILPLKGQLLLLLPRWASLRPPTLMIQGLADDLVPPANADFAEAHFPAGRLKVTRLPGQDHFLPWRHADLVKQSIQALLRQPSP